MAQTLYELNLEALLIKLLNERKIFHFKGNPQGLKGFPDRTILADREYHVELKVGKEGGSYYKQTPMQRWWQIQFENAKSVYVLLTGEKEIREFVSKIKT